MHDHMSEELKHYGVKGMKWGVIRDRTKDYLKTNTMKRHLAAGKKVVKLRGRMLDDAEDSYKNAEKSYQKALSRPGISRQKKMDRINEATAELTKSGLDRQRYNTDVNRAIKMYNQDFKAYEKHVKTLINKYGDKHASKLDKKTIDIGRNYTFDFIKTGVTIADLPGIGTYYSGRYISKKENEDRRKLLDKMSDKQL